MIHTITLNRPTVHNAMDLASWQRLHDEVARVGADPAVRVIVLRGAGPSFSSGIDIREIPLRRLGHEQGHAYNKVLRGAIETLLRCPKPIVGVLHGHVLGAGVLLAAACDVRFASWSLKLGFPAAARAIVHGSEPTQRLTELVGYANLKDLFLSARTVGAWEARRMGFVNFVSAPWLLGRRVRRYCERMLTCSPVAHRGNKWSIESGLWRVAVVGQDDAHRAEDTGLDSHDYREATMAYLENRQPTFKGE